MENISSAPLPKRRVIAYIGLVALWLVIVPLIIESMAGKVAATLFYDLPIFPLAVWLSRDDYRRIPHGRRWVIPDAVVAKIVFSLAISPFMPRTSVNQQAINGIRAIHPLATVIVVCTIGPVVEEVIFRSFFHRLFRRRWIGIALSAVIFGLLHATDASFFIYAGTSLIFSWAYEKAGLTGSTAVHAISNILSVLL